MSKRGNSRGIKNRLFLECGTVDMWDMKKYKGKQLQLHHFPPYRETRHTVYEESYLLTEENHVYLHQLEQKNNEEYLRRMEIIKENKKVLEKVKKK